ncbi:MAG TPA: efflux RND transporter periplasmic adaptor subunit, partial [Planctomycetaceae bacterium]|nr:efflux RND transporter periplasmic adaptor subunit [Planctomycetaceae bacterium]
MPESISHCQRIVLAAILVLSTAGCSRSPGGHSSEQPTSESTSAAVRVNTVHPTRKTLTRRTEQPGQIEAFERTPLLAKATGYVTRWNVDIGDTVKGPRYDSHGKLTEPGEVLAELSIPELDEDVKQKQALVAQAEAELKQALAAIKVATATEASAAAEVGQAKASATRADADYERWKSERDRMVALAEKGAVTRKLAEETENNFRASEAAQDETSAKIKSAESLHRVSQAKVEKAETDHQAAEARLLVARADYERAVILREYALIRAPFDGTVTARNVETGHLVRAAESDSAKPLFVVVRTDIVRIFVDVPEIDAVFARPKGSARVRIPALSSEPFAGEITRTAWVLNTGTRTLRTEIDVPNPDGKLRPGMYAHADILVAERPDALSIPKSAVLFEGTQAYCLCVD